MPPLRRTDRAVSRREEGNQARKIGSGRNDKNADPTLTEGTGESLPLADGLLTVDALAPPPAGTSMGIGPGLNREITRVTHQNRVVRHRLPAVKSAEVLIA